MTRHKKLLGRLLPCVCHHINLSSLKIYTHISESFFCSTECVTSDIESLVSFSFRCSCHNTRLVFPIDIFTFFSLLSLVWNVVLFHSPASFLTNCKLILWVFIYSTECVARRRRWKWKGMDRVAVEIAPHLRLFWHFPLLIPINMNRQHQHGMLTSSRQFTGLTMRWAWELNTIGERKSQINFLRHAINQADLYRLIKIDTQNFFCSMSISTEDSKRFIIYSMEIHQGRKFCVWNFQICSFREMIAHGSSGVKLRQQKHFKNVKEELKTSPQLQKARRETSKLCCCWVCLKTWQKVLNFILPAATEAS